MGTSDPKRKRAVRATRVKESGMCGIAIHDKKIGNRVSIVANPGDSLETYTSNRTRFLGGSERFSCKVAQCGEVIRSPLFSFHLGIGPPSEFAASRTFIEGKERKFFRRIGRVAMAERRPTPLQSLPYLLNRCCNRVKGFLIHGITCGNRLPVNG